MNDRTLRSRMKGDLHVRFWNSGRGSDPPVDCTWIMKLRDGEKWPGWKVAKKTLQESKKYDPELEQVYGKLLQEVYFRLHGSMSAFFRRVKNGKLQVFPVCVQAITSLRLVIQRCTSGWKGTASDFHGEGKEKISNILTSMLDSRKK